MLQQARFVWQWTGMRGELGFGITLWVENNVPACNEELVQKIDSMRSDSSVMNDQAAIRSRIRPRQLL